VALAAALAFAPAALAQEPFDRTQIPAPGKPPELRVPSWTKDKLANGADLIVSERHDLPLVSFTITFIGGSNQYEPAGQARHRQLCRRAPQRGTKTRDAEAISLALQLLGTSIGTSVGDESGSMSFVSTTASFQPTLEILTDLLVNPTFPEKGLERLRAQRLVALTQANAQPGAVGSRVFSRVLYGAEHPYGQRADETSLKAITRDDVMAFHRTYFQPGRAIVTVVGDVDPENAEGHARQGVRPLAGRRRAAGVQIPARAAAAEADDLPGGHARLRPVGVQPGASRPRARHAGLLRAPGDEHDARRDVPVAPEREHPRREGLQLRRPLRLRVRQGARPLQRRRRHRHRQVRRGAAGVHEGAARHPGGAADHGRGAGDGEELAHPAPARAVRRRRADQQCAITTLYVQGLPENYYQAYGKNIAAVTRDDVLRVAKQYIDLDRMAIVIVGDRKTIEEPLAKTGVAPIVHLDKEGKPDQALDLNQRRSHCHAARADGVPACAGRSEDPKDPKKTIWFWFS
jgi:zinc protease